MPVGNSPGFITQAEANQIGTGAVIEGQFQWDDDPTWTNTERAADLDLRANQMIAELQANYVAMFKFFGFTRS